MPDIASSEDQSMITLSWNKENLEEIALAEKKFREYIHKGWVAFVVTSDNEKKQVFTFDPVFERLQLIRLVEGG